MSGGISGREKRHALKDRGDDFYASPREAVDALLRVERDYLPVSESGVDFLMPFAVPNGIGGVVTNPPFKLAQEFVNRALGFSPYVAMLLRLSFLEGAARRPWFEATPLARVYVSSLRLPMMHRGDWDGPKAGSAIAFAWFVWDRRHEGRPHVHWFDWREAANDAG